LAVVLGELGLVASVSAGRNALFYSLVFVHAIAALVGFGSIGFAGTYASRAYLPVDAPGGSDGDPSQGDAGPTGEPENEAFRAGHEQAADALATGSPEVGAPDLGPGRPGPGPTPEGQSGGAESTLAPVRTAPAGEDEAEREELRRYFVRPAPLWWSLLAVPFLGLGALAADPNGGGLDQAWVLGALLVWLCAILVAASLVRPALYQMRSMLLNAGKQDAHAPGNDAERIRFARASTLASRGAAVCDVLFFVALALMIWRP
jgi:hypothetical protein